MTGKVSDSSMRDSSASPISLDTGMVNREAGKRMRGCGSAIIGSLELYMADDD